MIGEATTSERRMLRWHEARPSIRTTGARRTGDLGCSRALSTIVHASGWVSLLLYIPLYLADAYLPGQLD
jgi:hypothetical protein